jgi:hypothetical protein
VTKKSEIKSEVILNSEDCDFRDTEACVVRKKVFDRIDSSGHKSISIQIELLLLILHRIIHTHIISEFWTETAVSLLISIQCMTTSFFDRKRYHRSAFAEGGSGNSGKRCSLWKRSFFALLLSEWTNDSSFSADPHHRARRATAVTGRRRGRLATPLPNLTSSSSCPRCS